MLKKLFSLIIAAVFVLLVSSLIWPGSANGIARRVLGQLVQIGNALPIPIPGSEEELASDNSQPRPLLHLFQNKTPAAKLAIVDIIDATNKERVNAGLAPLKTNNLLIASAKIKVEDMIKLQYFEHESPDGKSVSDLGDDVGYSYVIMGENLALGNFAGPTDLITAWMNSPGHRANILNTQYQEIGIYAAKGQYKGREVWFAVQHFGTPRTVCPVIDQKLKAAIDSINAKLSMQQEQIAKLRREIETSSSSNEVYREKVRQFNILVGEYNKLLQQSQQMIATYNTQVKSFNNCIKQYQ